MTEFACNYTMFNLVNSSSITVWNLQKMTISPPQKESPLEHPPYLPEFSMIFIRSWWSPTPTPALRNFHKCDKKKLIPLEKFIWNHKINYFKVKDKAVCSYTMVSFGNPHVVLGGITHRSLNLLPNLKASSLLMALTTCKKKPFLIWFLIWKFQYEYVTQYYTFFLILRCLQWPRSDRISSRCPYWS